MDVPMRAVAQKRKSEDCEDAPAKRAKLDEPQLRRLRSLDAVQEFAAADGVRCVVVTAGWVPQASRAAAAAMKDVEKAGFAGAAVGHVKLHEDDACGEITFECNVPKAPCVLVFHNGKPLPAYTTADWSGAAVALKESVVAEVVVPPIASRDHFHSLTREDEFTVFDFYATWCAPCNRIKAHLPDLVEAFPKCKFFKISFDDYPDLRAQCNVQKIPTFVVYKNGEMKGALQHSDPEKVSNFISEQTASFMSFDEDF